MDLEETLRVIKSTLALPALETLVASFLGCLYRTAFEPTLPLGVQLDAARWRLWAPAPRPPPRPAILTPASFKQLLRQVKYSHYQYTGIPRNVRFKGFLIIFHSSR